MMSPLTKIRVTSLLAILCLICFVLYNLFLIISGDSYVLNSETVDGMHEHVISFIIVEFIYQAIIVGFMVSIFYQFYVGDIFSKKNLRLFFAIGVVFILYPVYSYIADLIIDLFFSPEQKSGSFTLNLSLILMPQSNKEHIVAGITILPIAYILNLGREIKSELDDYI
ncbi:hypothetical protein KCM76_04640 [Zooshikella marina]|uniref:hypothetical protein n=1 Tax=Zooshikella ganghwensis TaxID=202772 RepID=UPI001BAF88C6|nr:hypothetical protein [Zooshikella ganghwensis]MBU2705254.1 hypothetical protein [Zooshikella ganghwensis]